MREAAFGRRVAGDFGLAPTPAAVNVLGEIGEVREVAERTHDAHGLFARQAVEGAFQFAPRGDVVLPAEGHRTLPHALDQLERGRALLITHRVAEQAPEQPDVVAQRAVGFVVSVHVLLGARAIVVASRAPAR